MTEYRVTWTIDVDGETPEDAAREARKIQLDPQSTATVYQVTPHQLGARTEVIDLIDDLPDGGRLGKDEQLLPVYIKPLDD